MRFDVFRPIEKIGFCIFLTIELKNVVINRKRNAPGHVVWTSFALSRGVLVGVVVVGRVRDGDNDVVSVRGLFFRRLVGVGVGRRRRDWGGLQEESCDRAEDVVGRIPEAASLPWVDLVGGGGGGGRRGPGAAASEHGANTKMFH